MGITSITILLSVNTEPLGYVKQTQIRVAELLGSMFVLKSKDTETRDETTVYAHDLSPHFKVKAGRSSLRTVLATEQEGM